MEGHGFSARVGPHAAREIVRADRLLRYATLVFAAGFLLHTADHLRRGLDAITSQVFWSGNVSSLLILTAIPLLLGHRLGPLIAAVVGFTTAIGVTAVHLLPGWGAFSDSLSSGGADARSWVAVLAEIVGAAVFGMAGVYALSCRERWH